MSNSLLLISNNNILALWESCRLRSRGIHKTLKVRDHNKAYASGRVSRDPCALLPTQRRHLLIPTTAHAGMGSVPLTHPTVFSSVFCLFVFFKNIYLFELEANYFTIMWWVLPYIDLNQPWVYMCPPILNPSPTSLATPSLWVVPEHQL